MFSIKFKQGKSPEDAKRKYARKKKQVQNGLSTAFKKVSIYLDQWVQQNFQTQGKKSDPKGWQPFKYPEWGRHITGKGWDASAKLLMDTGRLRASVIPFHNAMDAGVGSDLDYSKIHDEGIGVPQRRILPRQSKNPEVRKKAYRILDNEINKALLK